MPLPCIPRYNFCTYFFEDLTAVVSLITVFFIGLAIYDMTVVHHPICRDISYPKLTEGWHVATRILAWVRIALGVILLLSAITFFQVLSHECDFCCPVDKIADFFNIVAILSSTTRMLYTYAALSRICLYAYKCDKTLTHRADTLMILFTLLSFYFIAVLNSFSYQKRDECCADEKEEGYEEENNECGKCAFTPIF